MNVELIPDIAATATLIVLLEVFRRRNPEQRIRQWLIGLCFIFIEGVARLFYSRTGPMHIPMHILALDSYVIAGALFVSSARRQVVGWKARVLTYFINVLPVLVIETMYGADYRGNNLPYYLCGAFALISGLVLAIGFPRTLSGRVRSYLGFRFFNWLPALAFIYLGQMRAVAYWLLATLFLTAGIRLHQTLPRRTAGKFAIVAGFTMWAVCFAIHPIVDSMPMFSEIASRFWDLQKFIVMVGMLMVLLDEQIESNRSLALHDELTGLPNRRLLEDRLDQSISRAEREKSRTAVLVMDLNGFKNVNDTLGHAAGDDLLRMVASRLRSIVRTADTLARLGGDEFVLVVSGLNNPEALYTLRSSVQRAINGYYDLHGQALPVEASIGAAIYPDDAASAEELLDVADQRMYEQKHQRRRAQESYVPVGNTQI